MKSSLFQVDFNELLEPDLIALSQDETKLNYDGEECRLFEGMEIVVFTDDNLDERGEIEFIVASGAVEKHNFANSPWDRVKWWCRIDQNGIRYTSNLNNVD